MDGVDFLYNKGKRNIAFVTGPKKVEISNLRFKGYKKAMMKYNIYDKNLVFYGDFNINEEVIEEKQIYFEPVLMVRGTV